MKILIREIDETLPVAERNLAIREAEEGMLRDVLLQAWLLRDAHGNLIGGEDMASRESIQAREAAAAAPLPEILRTEHGKPYIPSLEEFHYNISHSGRFVVLAAVYPDHDTIRPSEPSEIGVDIQEMRSLRDGIDAMARRYYTPEEAAFLTRFQENEPGEREIRERLFYTLWAIKEAYLKCIGTGLTGMMSSFDIEPASAGRDAGVIRDRESGTVKARYLVLSPPDDHYTMAVCLETSPESVPLNTHS